MQRASEFPQSESESNSSVSGFTGRHALFDGILGCLRRFSCVVSSAFGYSSELESPSGNRHLIAMASVDPIDISSSDDDSDLREIDNYRDESPVRDTASSIPARILPAWATSALSNFTGHNGSSRKEPSSSSKRLIVHDEISPRPHKRLNIADSIGASSSRMGGPLYLTNGSNNAARLGGTSHETHTSHQPMKRALPASFQPSTSSVRSKNPVENVGSSVRSKNPVENVGASEIREMYGRSNQSGPWSNSANGKNSMRENFNHGSLNDSSFHERRGNRLLPPSMMAGKFSSAAGGSNDPFHQTGSVEENPAVADERFVFQAAVQDLHQPKLEANLPDGILSVSLLRHQKIALAWMVKQESSSRICLGGILADDQGLGKTVSTIALIQMQRALEAKSKSKNSSNTGTVALNLDADDGGSTSVDLTKESQDFTILPEESNTVKGFSSSRPTAGTLIVCPASVLRQWARELDEKVTDEARLSVLIYHGGSRTKDPAELAKYDVVLTTYAIVTNEVPKQPLVEGDDDEQKDAERYGLSSAFSTGKKQKKPYANKKSKKGKKEIDASMFDSSCGTLARVKWARVVLDESQTIKNHRTQVARACCSLKAKRRWCLSGTPIQNSIDELYSYFRFLRYDPYDQYKIFVSTIKYRISRDSINGYKKLQIVLRNIMLRRTKGTFIDGKPIINLPPKRINLTSVEFSVEERAFYRKLEADSKKQFKEYAAAGTVNQNYANILLLLLRLRQACDHPLLVKGLNSDPVGKVSSEMAKILPRELLVNLLNQLETSLAICLACRDPPENAVVTMCGHVFCYQCVSDYLTGEDNTCPAPHCKEQLGADVVYSRSTLRRCICDDVDGDIPAYELGEKSKVLQRNYVSSKIKSVLEILNAHCISKKRSPEVYDLVRYEGGDNSHSVSKKRSPEVYDLVRYDGGGDGASSSSGDLYLVESGSKEREKAIIFSQWTSMLDLVEISMRKSCINYRRLDGTMSIAARDKAVKEFNTDPEVDVMLMSLKAGNLGLNMVAACRVILLDLWWNPATEDQAVDRAHRIGQTRPVTVSRLTIKDTVEDRILALQEDKRKMVASAFGEDQQSGGPGKRLTVDDLRFLFEGSGR